jgi:ribosome-associated protein YbcJ (S4-like RNA binding protein)
MYDGINAGHVRFSGEGETRKGCRTLDEPVRGWLG